MTITTDNEAFRIAVADLRSASDRLGADSRRIGHEVDALLDRWTGVAADAFAEAWHDWQCGARDVLDGLTTMGRLLDAVHRDLHSRDLESGQRLGVVTAHLAARLG
jgi:WXG100 family type VII secretion target